MNATVPALSFYGFIDRTGTIVIPAQFEIARTFSEGMAFVEKKDKKGFIDKSGRIILEPNFESLGDFSEGYAPVWVSRKPAESPLL